MSTAATEPESTPDRPGRRIPYKWSVLTNTTLGMLMATINASILIISLPAIFDGLRLDPLAPGNVSYLLWMLMGYMLVTAVLVVTLGRLGDMYGRVKIYNAGFAVFTAASIALALTPMDGAAGAVWLIGFRVLQGVGGAMIMANSTAIITDAFPARQRGTALGVNQVAGLAGSFLGLVLGGVLSAWHWRAIFWVSVIVGVVGAFWAYKNLREAATRREGVRIDWWGNLTLAVGLTALLAATGLTAQGVPGPAVAAVAAVPPVSLMFAAFLGSNPIAQLLNAAGVLHSLPGSTVTTLTSKTFLPQLLTGQFHSGLTVVFILAAVLAFVGAVVSLFRGGVYIHDEVAPPAGKGAGWSA